MPRVNIYLPDDLAEKVKHTEGLNTSAICQQALTKELGRLSTMTALAEDIDRIELDMGDHDVAFTGRWLLEPDSELTRADDEEGFVGGAYWGVALTAKGKTLVYTADFDDRWAPQMFTCDRLEAIRGQVPEGIYTAAMDAAGERVTIELDI